MSFYESLHIFFVFCINFFLIVDQRLLCLDPWETEASDSSVRDGVYDDSVYILLFFPALLLVILTMLIILFFWRHDLYLFLRMSLLRLFLRYCMHIEDESDGSYISSSVSLWLESSDTSPHSSLSEDSKSRDKYVTPDSAGQSSWDSRFHNEAEIIARIISNQGEGSDSASSDSILSSSSSSYLPLIKPIVDEFIPLSVEEDSELDTIVTDCSVTVPKIAYRDQFTQTSTLEYSSEDQLNSTRSDQNSDSNSIIPLSYQTSQFVEDENSSEDHLNLTSSDQNSEPNSSIPLRCASDQIGEEENSSEDHLNLNRSSQNTRCSSNTLLSDHNTSDQNNGSCDSIVDIDQDTHNGTMEVNPEQNLQSDSSASSVSINEHSNRPFFKTRSGKIYYKNI